MMVANLIAGIALSAWLAALFVAVRALLAYQARNERPVQVQDAQWSARLAALETTVQGLPSLWEEERSRAQRAAERARVSERRIRALRDESDEEPDEDIDVPRGDAARGHPQGVLPLHPDVGRPQELDHVARANAQGLTPWALAGF